MAKKGFRFGMLVTALITAFVLGMAVLGACSTTPPSEPVLPDRQSAVVYFFGYKSDKASVWDGTTPIGDFGEGASRGNIAWKTTPGEHYFMANTFNWAVIRANLQANKTYYVKLEWIPNPIPFAKNFVAFSVLEPEDGEDWFNKSRTTSFTDEWRAKYAQGERLQEAREQLQEARNDRSMEVRLR
jgi:hypothetical protein